MKSMLCRARIHWPTAVARDEARGLVAALRARCAPRDFDSVVFDEATGMTVIEWDDPEDER